MNKKENDEQIKSDSPVKIVVTTALGGIMLFISTIVLNAFVSSPPSRAEFDSFKATIETKTISIDRRLKNLEDGQSEIIKTILKQGEKR